MDILYLIVFLAIGPISSLCFPAKGTDDSEENYITSENDSEMNNNNTEGYMKSIQSAEQLINPEELGPYFEGDIISYPPGPRNGWISTKYRWSNGIIPYIIQGAFNDTEKDIIKHGFQEFHTKTCLSFIPRTKQKDYISINSKSGGCFSSIGKIGGKQDLNMERPTCFKKVGTFIHELMHAIGYDHEHNRLERDNHITIMWKNIRQGADGYFAKVSMPDTNPFGVKYDIESLLHYSARAFSGNKKPTIVPKNPEAATKMGQRVGFSEGDLLKINKMYKCKIVATPSTTTSNPKQLQKYQTQK